MSASVPTGGRLRARDHPFFDGFDDRLLEMLEDRSVDRSWAADEYLFREGDSASQFFLIFQGKVALEAVGPDRPHLTIETIGSWEVVGWSWLVPPFLWSLDGRAVKPTRALVLDAGVLRSTFDERPADGFRFLLRLLPVIADRLDNTRVRLLDLHGA